MSEAIGIGLVVIAGVAMMPTAGAFFMLAYREKRWPNIVLMIEVIGRWWQIPSERKDRLVATAAIGYQIALPSLLVGAALVHFA